MQLQNEIRRNTSLLCLPILLLFTYDAFKKGILYLLPVGIQDKLHSKINSSAIPFEKIESNLISDGPLNKMSENEMAHSTLYGQIMFIGSIVNFISCLFYMKIAAYLKLKYTIFISLILAIVGGLIFYVSYLMPLDVYSISLILAICCSNFALSILGIAADETILKFFEPLTHQVYSVSEGFCGLLANFLTGQIFSQLAWWGFGDQIHCLYPVGYMILVLIFYAIKLRDRDRDLQKLGLVKYEQVELLEADKLIISARTENPTNNQDSVTQTLHEMVNLLSIPKIKLLSLNFVQAMSLDIFTRAALPIYLTETLKFSKLDIGDIFSVNGITMIVASGLLVYLLKRFDESESFDAGSDPAKPRFSTKLLIFSNFGFILFLSLVGYGTQFIVDHQILQTENSILTVKTWILFCMPIFGVFYTFSLTLLLGEITVALQTHPSFTHFPNPDKTLAIFHSLIWSITDGTGGLLADYLTLYFDWAQSTLIYSGFIVLITYLLYLEFLHS